jgi:hypothetical protein
MVFLANDGRNGHEFARSVCIVSGLDGLHVGRSEEEREKNVKTLFFLKINKKHGHKRGGGTEPVCILCKFVTSEKLSFTR